MTYVKSDSPIDINRDNIQAMDFENGEYHVLMEGLYQISVRITIITDSGFNGRANLISVFKTNDEHIRFTRLTNGNDIAYNHSQTIYLEQDDIVSVKYLHNDNQDLKSEAYQGSELQFQLILLYPA